MKVTVVTPVYNGMPWLPECICSVAEQRSDVDIEHFEYDGGSTDGTHEWLEAHRGRGLSKAMMRAVMSPPGLQPVRRFTLGTRDAHGLYAQFGFTPVAKPENQMEKRNPQPWQTPAGPAPG